jgi:hypothetical protein
VELLVIAVVVGLVVLALLPVAKASQRRRSPHDQDAVTRTDVRPPREPGKPIPGSRDHRRRRGMP